jgi:hypothetical protein
MQSHKKEHVPNDFLIWEKQATLRKFTTIGNKERAIVDYIKYLFTHYLDGGKSFLWVETDGSEGLEIEDVETVDYSPFRRGFRDWAAKTEIRQNKAGHIFNKQDWRYKDGEARQRVYEHFKNLAALYGDDLKWGTLFNQPVLPMVHGTGNDAAQGIKETGFAALASLYVPVLFFFLTPISDAGYYGQGKYSLHYPLSALPSGPLLVPPFSLLHPSLSSSVSVPHPSLFSIRFDGFPGIYFSSSSKYILPYLVSKPKPVIILTFVLPGLQLALALPFPSPSLVPSSFPRLSSLSHLLIPPSSLAVPLHPSPSLSIPRPSIFSSSSFPPSFVSLHLPSLLLPPLFPPLFSSPFLFAHSLH